MTEPYIFDRITLIGLGLIGSSIARACRTNQAAYKIVGCDDSETVLAYARQQNIVDVAMRDPRTAVAHSNLVILATPPSTLAYIAQQIGPLLTPGTLVMDTASVKLAAVEAIAPYLPPHVHFIPAHPIAGSELSGISASSANLFERRRVVVTPEAPLEGELLKKITRFWGALGARVEGMPAALHDHIYAYVSHLPQLLAYAVGQTIPGYARQETLSRFLRKSSANIQLWAEIFALNKTNLLAALDRYLDAISHIVNELKSAPADASPVQPADPALAATVLFPRIAASCLITTVMEAERKAGLSFARYSGAGFADFASPATSAPDNDLERISSQYPHVVALLETYSAHLKQWREKIEGPQAA